MKNFKNLVNSQRPVLKKNLILLLSEDKVSEIFIINQPETLPNFMFTRTIKLTHTTYLKYL